MLSRESKRGIIGLTIAVVLLIGGVVFVLLGRKPVHAPTVDTSAPSEQAAPQEPTTPAALIVRYEGQEGQTALALLKQGHRVETKTFSGIGEFVESIDGVRPPEGYFWKFFINDQDASVGAGDYVTKKGDLLEWRIEKIQQ
jgi:hypothetical protein